MASAGSPLFKVKAAYDYTSAHEDDLSFSQGQIIVVTEEEGSEWYIGEYTDSSGNLKSGLFPSNFVERYEPAPPPRPVRSVKPRQAETQAEPAFASSQSPAAPQPATFTQHGSPKTTLGAPDDVDSDPPVPIPNSVSGVKRPSNSMGTGGDSLVAAESPPAAKEPPSIAAKSSSFRDRIAAFNKTAAPPIAPFKPSNLGSSGFIKKPFVAPPPSRNAYVPPAPRDIPAQTFYRREEDPEIAERQAQDFENAERAGLVPATEGDDDDDELAKPVSLKERIALLQKQQMEQATRRGEAAAKEKPKKPVKRRTESQDGAEDDTELTYADNEAKRSTSIDEPRAAPPPPPRAPSMPVRASDDEYEQQGVEGNTETSLPLQAAQGSQQYRPQATNSDRSDDAGSQQADREDEAAEASDGEESLDEETRHQMALRQRMAKLSGGMGMPGMFGPPGGLPMMGMTNPTQKRKNQDHRHIVQEDEQPSAGLARVPSVPSAGLQRKQSLDQRKSLDEHRNVPPQRAGNVESDHAPVDVASPSAGSETDDELPGTSRARDSESAARDTPSLPSAPPVPRRQDSMRSSNARPEVTTSFPTRTSSAASKDVSPATSQVPRIPSNVVSVDQRPATVNESEYEGDYDTDIASSAKHKEALKAHSREHSTDESAAVDVLSTTSPIDSVNRFPARPVPPPPPAESRPRISLDAMPAATARSPQMSLSSPGEEDDYDPYRYGPPIISPSRSGANSPLIVSPPIPTGTAPPPLPMNAPPPPIPSNVAPPPIPAGLPPPSTSQRRPQELPENDEEYELEREDTIDQEVVAIKDDVVPRELNKRNSRAEVIGTRSTRSSVDVDRTPVQRRSIDQHRLSTSNEYIASDINVDESSRWWTLQQGLPPVWRDRNDIFHESEETTVQKRGGKSLINRDIYVLFRDYSQTVLSVRFDAKNPADVSFEQRHEPPPPPMRQDQLEAAYGLYGAALAEAANASQNHVVGEGSPQDLIDKLVADRKAALPPVGTRAYGALVYTNLANATVQQFDEIRPGDIVSFRNAKFQGKHSGVMHQKYQTEAGKPDHAAIVLEWDGTKKKIRAVEQGRESKKCKVESFRLGDLRSGEVRVWRLMSRSWVGWDA